MYKKGITWQNTNKLLGIVGYRGLKTGYTPKAGGCLSSVFETNKFSANECTLVVIVLGSKTQEHRFVDTSRLVEYATEEVKVLLK
jgi:D-alanyl-D-alanine carboxypeptidase (penicillin-binding protein 5/6)